MWLAWPFTARPEERIFAASPPAGALHIRGEGHQGGIQRRLGGFQRGLFLIQGVLGRLTFTERGGDRISLRGQRGQRRGGRREVGVPGGGSDEVFCLLHFLQGRLALEVEFRFGHTIRIAEPGPLRHVVKKPGLSQKTDESS